VNSILIVAGENSGEKYGADLIRAYLELRPQDRFFGLGGPEMAASGTDILYSLEELNIVGIFEALRSWRRVRQLLVSLRNEALRRKAKAAVLIDSPDFNLRLARMLRAAGIPVLYYISPTIWAWRAGRLNQIRRYVNRMLLIFPFEKEIYDKAGIPAIYVGHPLLSRLKVKLSASEFRTKYNLPPETPLITLLPGSRPMEISRHGPILSKSIDLIMNKVNASFILIRARTVDKNLIERFFVQQPELLILDETEDKYEAMAASDIILAACGTANMEACLLEVPFIAFYRISPLVYFLGRKLVRVKNYSIVNILAGKRLVPELIQEKFTPENLAGEVLSLLSSPEKRETMKKEFRCLRELLGDDRAPVRAATELKNLIDQI